MGRKEAEMKKIVFLMLFLLGIYLIGNATTVNYQHNVNNATEIRGIPVEDTTGQTVALNWGLVLNGATNQLIWLDLSSIISTDTTGSMQNTGDTVTGDYGITGNVSITGILTAGQIELPTGRLIAHSVISSDSDIILNADGTGDATIYFTNSIYNTLMYDFSYSSFVFSQRLIVPDPVLSTQAATKNYHDSALVAKASYADSASAIDTSYAPLVALVNASGGSGELKRIGTTDTLVMINYANDDSLKFWRDADGLWNIGSGGITIVDSLIADSLIKIVSPGGSDTTIITNVFLDSIRADEFGNGGSFLPLSGGTLTGALSVPSINLNSTGSSRYSIIYGYNDGSSTGANFWFDSTNNFWSTNQSFRIGLTAHISGNIRLNIDGDSTDAIIYAYENGSQVGASIDFDSLANDWTFSHELEAPTFDIGGGHPVTYVNSAIRFSDEVLIASGNLVCSTGTVRLNPQGAAGRFGLYTWDDGSATGGYFTHSAAGDNWLSSDPIFIGDSSVADSQATTINNVKSILTDSLAGYMLNTGDIVTGIYRISGELDLDGTTDIVMNKDSSGLSSYISWNTPSDGVKSFGYNQFYKYFIVGDSLSMANKTIINLADPVNIDDAATKNYVDTANPIKDSVYSSGFTITSPGSINDTVTWLHISDLKFPSGITLTRLEIQTNDTTGTYALEFEEWTGKQNRSRVGYIDTLTVLNDSSYTRSGTFTDASIAAENDIRIIIPSTIVDEIHCTVYYYRN